MKVLITNAVPDEHVAPLSGIAEVSMGPAGGDTMPRAEVLDHADELDGIINQAELRVDAELLDAAPKLRVVANVAIGTDNLDLDLMARRGVWATNVPNAFVDSTADCTVGMVLAVARRLVEADRYVRSGAWRSFQPGLWDGMELRGKQWGIIGYGKIGRAVAERARAFGVSVVAHDPAAVDVPEYRDLDDLLSGSDIVSVHVPLTDGTRGLIDADALASMKPGAILANLARGPVVVEEALVASLRDGRLAGAALDVFEEEPMVHPDLIEMANVVLSPHIGGGTRESRKRARLQCARNVAAVLSGRTPETPVNEASR